VRVKAAVAAKSGYLLDVLVDVLDDVVVDVLDDVLVDVLVEIDELVDVEVLVDVDVMVVMRSKSIERKLDERVLKHNASLAY